MGAKVVFSDGSKQMAHNLDDLYERWQMRRDELERERRHVIAPDEAIDLFVPELPAFTSSSETKAYRAGLIEKQAFLQIRLGELNLRRQTSYFPDPEFHRARAPMALAVSRVNLQIHQLTALTGNRQALPVRIAALKAKEQDGSITVAEQMEVATLRDLERGATLEGGLAKAERSSDQERLATMEGIINDQRKWLNTVQAKLIAAYEQIMELQQQRGEKP